MKKSLLTIIALSSLVFSADIPVRTGQLPKKEQMISQKVELAKMVADEASKKLPQVIDNYTTLATVKSKDSMVIYTFEINTGSKSDETIRKEDRSRMKEAVTTGVCKASYKLLLGGIDTTYLYVSAKTKAKLFEFIITKEDCPIILE